MTEHRRRLPYRRLERLAVTAILDREQTHTCFGPPGAAQIAALVGSNQRQVVRWRSCGTLTEAAADLAATRLGLHLLEIWPNAYDDLTESNQGENTP